ncbi:MAG: RNA methyltransferase [bacterium]|nr:RNA methyltransferase [bacterium]
MESHWVESLADERIADYRNVRDADLRRQRGLFMAEGRLVVESLIKSPYFRANSVFVTPRSFAAMQGVLEDLPAGIPVYRARQEVFNQIVGFDLHRGCLAVGDTGVATSPEMLLQSGGEGQSTLAILEGLTNTENIGGIFRNAMAFGVDGVLLCPRSCDPLYRQSIRVSMGGTLRVPHARFDAWPTPLEMLRDHGYQIIALDLAPDAISISRLDREAALGSRVALLVGTEGAGVSASALDRVDYSLRIPMAAGVDSLNVSTATGIAMQWFHARSDHLVAGGRDLG